MSSVFASPSPSGMRALLKERFGFDAFRPFQEEVCAAVFKGEDALLVMPTGAGKSLCYQLPGLARAGTTLVVSPLVALMEDQVAKLRELGLRAERIHSGRERAESRAVCEAYLEGGLDFLFIAPERLGVAGFPEMLARKRLALIAIDEAHCISAWGHDFRPDYRMLGTRLPLLRQGPADGGATPLLALTATATPTVQRDILEQLGLPGAHAFIHGFRRNNIAIEVEELAPAARAARILDLLAGEGRLPVIVYANTRKTAEALAKELGAVRPTELYHAGLSKEERDRTQVAFLSGRAEVMVATIAFGMGIDKANVRSVVHASLPSTLEGYYQEIGRAGRDGLPSKAWLLWSYADRRMHEFLHAKNYPAVSSLERIRAEVDREPGQAREALGETLALEGELFEAALQKLWIHGGVRVGADDRLQPGNDTWKASYTRQERHRLEQMRLMAGFAEGSRCRMLHLVQHFGDERDSGQACGLCDVCAPGEARLRPPTDVEAEEMLALLKALREREGQSLGRIHREVASKLDRKDFERRLLALAKAGFIFVEDRSFEKDGKSIHYRSAHVLAASVRATDLLLKLRLPEEAAAVPGARRSRSKVVKADPATLAPPPAEVLSGLKAWRQQEARARKVPAFMILSDKVLKAIASLNPSNLEGLGQVHGMGPKLVEKHGRRILEVLAASPMMH
jgi:DNA topoisomerase-3